jgi:NDP-sugar pyrophosphorylase family protein
MQVAILAGGLATRLRPLTNTTAKSLIEICGKPFLGYQLGFLKKGGVKNIVLCVGYLGEQIEKHFGDGRELGVNIKYSYESEQLLGTAGALKNAERLLEDEFFIMYGDSYLFLDFVTTMSYFNKFDKLGLMTVYKNYNRYDSSNLVLTGNLVKQYSKKEKSKEMVYIDYGVSILKKKALELVPPNQICSLEELFDQLINRKELLAYEVDERFYQIGSPEGLEEFKKYILSEGTQ